MELGRRRSIENGDGGKRVVIYSGSWNNRNKNVGLSKQKQMRLLSRAGSTSSRDSCSPPLSNKTVVVLVLDDFTIQDGWGRVKFRIFRICEENRQSWN